MKKILVAALLCFFLSGLPLLAGDITLGETLKLDKPVLISEILANPESFVGKTVRLEGYIIEGCRHHGRWIALAGDKEFQSFEVWPKKDTFMFPLDHKGKYAIVEGAIYAEQLNEEEATQWLKHLNEGHEQQVDLAKAKGGMKIFRIAPYGAIIKETK